MGFRDKKWKCRYVAGRDNPLNEFFIPALTESKNYYRIAGYFSSTVLAAAASGVARFVDTGEKMKLIVGAEFYKDDIDAIEDLEYAIQDDGVLKYIDDLLDDLDAKQRYNRW